MDEFFVVDRVENNIAVLECPDGKFFNVEVESDGTFTLSNDEEKKRKAQAYSLQEKIFGNR